MIKELFISLKESINKKTTNPFLGTYIIVLIWRNWKLFYSVFNFDDGMNLNQKIEYINTYLLNKNLFEELGLNVLVTFGIILLTYSFINLSRLIINFFEKQVTPRVYKLTDESSIVTKVRYDQLNQSYSELEKKVDQEKELRIKSQTEIEKLESKLEAQRIKELKTREEFTAIEKELIQLKSFESYHSQNQNVSESVTNESQAIENLEPSRSSDKLFDAQTVDESTKKVIDKIDEIFDPEVVARKFVDKLVAKDLVKDYVLCATNVNNNNKLPTSNKSNGLSLYLYLGLIESSQIDGEILYRLSEDGKRVLRILRVEN